MVDHHPADHAAPEDFEDDVEVEVRPFDRAQQLGYVPSPDLIGSGGQQFRLLVMGMAELVAALLQLSISSQDAVHGADRAEIDALVEQGGIDLGWRLVAEALGV